MPGNMLMKNRGCHQLATFSWQDPSLHAVFLFIDGLRRIIERPNLLEQEKKKEEIDVVHISISALRIICTSKTSFGTQSPRSPCRNPLPTRFVPASTGCATSLHYHAVDYDRIQATVYINKTCQHHFHGSTACSVNPDLILARVQSNNLKAKQR